MEVVGVVLLAIVLLAGIAFSLSAPAARRVLEGRALQRALMAKVGSVMTTPAVVVTELTPVEDAAELMVRRNIGALPVVSDDGRMVGIVTESDLTGAPTPYRVAAAATPSLGEDVRSRGADIAYHDVRHVPVREVMHRDVITASKSEPVTVAVSRMMDHRLRRLPVVDRDTPIGMITRHDLLSMIARRTREVPATEPTS